MALECWKKQDHPWEFPICDILYAIKAYERFPLVNPAGYAQQKVDQIQSLKDRLDRNMSDFQAELLGMDKMEIIAMSAEISAMQGAHNFMKKYFKFEPGNAEILLRMENPLKFVATQWRSDVAELFDMNAQVGEAIVEAGKEAAVLRYFAAPEQRQAISAEVQATLQMLVDTDLKLHGEVTGDTLEAIQTRLQAEQAARRFTVTGVLLDKGTPGMAFSLQAFCQNIYRTSELLGDEIVRELVNCLV